MNHPAEPGSHGQPLPVERGWEPARLDRLRALGRRAVIVFLGHHVEWWLRGVYHRALRGLGRFEPPENEPTRAVLAAVAAQSRTILDIGANVGVYAWFLLRHAPPSSRLFALEPNPAAAQLLRSAVGKSPRCTVFDVAAADRDEIAELVVPDGPFGAPTSALAWVRSRSGDKDRRVLRIATRRIDGLIDDGSISVVGPVFLKIDVEGAEGRVLRGAAALLRHHRPVIYFECQTSLLARQGETPADVWNELGRAGYRIFVNRASRFVPVDEIQPDAANYLAIPTVDVVERDFPMDAASIIGTIGRWATRGSKA